MPAGISIRQFRVVEFLPARRQQGSDLSTGCQKFVVQALRDAESGSPQLVHFGANRRQKPYSFGSHHQSEHTRNPQSQPLRLPPTVPIVQQEPVRAKVQGQINRFCLTTAPAPLS